jgi:hypothetical protein
MLELHTANAFEQEPIKEIRRLGLTDSLPSVSQLSRQNGGASTSQNPIDLHGLLQG